MDASPDELAELALVWHQLCNVSDDVIDILTGEAGGPAPTHEQIQALGTEEFPVALAALQASLAERATHEVSDAADWVSRSMTTPLPAIILAGPSAMALAGSIIALRAALDRRDRVLRAMGTPD
ncbi:hypothetical protein [Bailinhaonella thermotolerans]|uniref:Uncharacterized protein n=1 Tax=Bailinhaonella thermotolerans TaxID=1070861 RepID=A0A3A4A305_9ACTN|nr:hypothetical protein [Bailinhaonella thermotolerans]RJL21090.1 hypothetical protein D5H75_38410 [Bailinhaonella thermotolerans]